MMTELAREYSKERCFAKDIDYRYIFCLKNTDNNRTTYFLNEEDTHFAFAFPKLKVGLLRVIIDSPEYIIAVENSYNCRNNFLIK